MRYKTRIKPCKEQQSFWYERTAGSTAPQRITGDDRAHDVCDGDPPYRRVRSPVNTPVHQDARNRPGAKPPAARDCPLACSISQEREEVDRDWSETGGMYLL